MPKSASPAVRHSMSGIAIRAALASVAVVLLALGGRSDARPAAAEGPSVPAAGLDFSIGIDTDGDTTDDCSSSGTPTNECVLGAQETFGVNVYLNSLPDKVPAYEMISIVLEYDGVNWTFAERWAWPDAFCLRLAIVPEDDGRAELPCGTAMTLSDYTGLMVTTDFRCNESGSIALVHGRGDTVLAAAPGGTYVEGEGTSEALTIICSESPTATPTPTPVPMYGDVNCDGDIDSVDSLLILQYHAALFDSLPCLENADVNGDGRVNSVDAWWVLQDLVKIWPLRSGQVGGHSTSALEQGLTTG